VKENIAVIFFKELYTGTMMQECALQQAHAVLCIAACSLIDRMANSILTGIKKPGLADRGYI